MLLATNGGSSKDATDHHAGAGNGVVPTSSSPSPSTPQTEIGVKDGVVARKEKEEEEEGEEDYGANLTTVETVKSAVDRHDMYREIGRLETRDIREKSKSAALGY